MQGDEMWAYYEALAPEYEEVYAGRGLASGPPATRYLHEVPQVARLLSGFGTGHLIDVGCGTGFWLQFYAPQCTRITLLDQSSAALSESLKRVQALHLGATVDVIEGDFFDVTLPASVYDSAVVGFVLSHVPADQEELFFRRLRSLLKPNAKVAVMDSCWSEVRRLYKVKEGVEARRLKDGRSFNIYKRYFEPPEFEAMLGGAGFAVDEVYVGDIIVAATAHLV